MDTNNFFLEGDVQTVNLRTYVRWFVYPPSPEGAPVQLPPIQRGWVWKLGQVERLWDSLLRGFPIGSFLLSPFKSGVDVVRDIAGAQRKATCDGWFLLDGQQRTRALLTGFQWTDVARLWLDMSPPTKSAIDRTFLFRLCTRSDPWGRQSSDPERRVEEHTLRQAREQLKGQRWKDQGSPLNDFELDLDETWPVQAELPVPVWRLLERMESSGSCAGLPDWDDLLPAAKRKDIGRLRNADFERQVGDALRRALARNLVLLKVDPSVDPLVRRADGDASVESDRPDALETLFERVNSGGTRLEGEEMMYSLLKAKWPDAYDLVESIAKNKDVGYFLPPSGIVLTTTRLALSRVGTAEQIDRDVPRPKVRQFRRWISERSEGGASGETFFERMKAFIDRVDGEPKFLRLVCEFLRVVELRSTDSNDPGLPRPLILKLDRYAIDVVLRWIDSRSGDSDFRTACEQSRLGILRFLIYSLLGWTIPEQASRRGFSVLATSEYERFPDVALYQRSLAAEDGRAAALRMPDPDELTTSLVSPDRRLRSYGELFVSPTCGEFLKRFWDRHYMLLWFQRAGLSQLFQGYDPFKHENMLTPFDYDHILPRSNLAKPNGRLKFAPGIEQSEQTSFESYRATYRDSIGNYRIWPAAANRADQDLSPKAKLGLDEPEDSTVGAWEKRLRFVSWREVRAASAISEEHVELWSMASGEPLDWTDPNRRIAFLSAIESRVIHLYRCLWSELDFGVWQEQREPTETLINA